MAEERTFRPERRPLTDVENLKVLSDIDKIKKMAEHDEEEFAPDISKLPITGPIPPEVQRMLEEGMREKQRHSQRPQQMMQQKPTKKPNITHEMVTDNHLQEVLASLRSNVAYDAVYLPSGGKFYDGENGPIDGVLHIRPMTGKEEEILATQRFIKKGQAINMIFKNCIQENYDADKFLGVDRVYLLIYLRGISYSQEYDVEIKCPECDRKFATIIELGTLEVERCPDDFNISNLSGTLPNTGFSFSYRLSRGFDDQQVQDHKDRKLKGFDNIVQSDDTLLFRTTLLVEEIHGFTDKNDILELLKQLPINDVAHLRNVCTTPPFGVNTDVEIHCPGCLQDFTVDLPLEANFFFPRARKKVR
jgi:hypothetical protein